jgi:hypothetical protein
MGFLAKYLNHQAIECAMKKAIITILMLLIIVSVIGCSPTPDTEPVEVDEPEQETERSECDGMSEGPRKLMCLAIEAEDVTMCELVIGRFRDPCVIALAELVYDTSLVQHCDLADSETYDKICRALFSEDIGICFSSWGQGEGLGASLNMRDCLDLTARKIRDPELCNLFVSRSSDLMYVCGDTGDCEGQWITGADDHAKDCKYAVNEAIQYDAEQ